MQPLGYIPALEGFGTKYAAVWSSTGIWIGTCQETPPRYLELWEPRNVYIRCC